MPLAKLSLSKLPSFEINHPRPSPLGLDTHMKTETDSLPSWINKLLGEDSGPLALHKSVNTLIAAKTDYLLKLPMRETRQNNPPSGGKSPAACKSKELELQVIHQNNPFGGKNPAAQYSKKMELKAMHQTNLSRTRRTIQPVIRRNWD